MRCPWTHTALTVLDHRLLETHFSTVSSFQVNACVATHIGDRQDQQDRVAIITSPRNPGALLAIVADGMGGRTGGRQAADQVISTAENLFRDMSHKDATLRDLLLHLAAEAHTIIRLTAVSAEKEPHSTLCALVIQKQTAVWAHVGDSRLYHFRDGKLLHRTEDHTYAQQLREEGRLEDAELASVRYKNVLVSALGIDSGKPKVEVARRERPRRRRHLPAGERRPVGALFRRRTRRGPGKHGSAPGIGTPRLACAGARERPRRQRLAGHREARSARRVAAPGGLTHGFGNVLGRRFGLAAQFLALRFPDLRLLAPLGAPLLVLLALGFLFLRAPLGLDLLLLELAGIGRPLRCARLLLGRRPALVLEPLLVVGPVARGFVRRDLPAARRFSRGRRGPGRRRRRLGALPGGFLRVEPALQVVRLDPDAAQFLLGDQLVATHLVAAPVDQESLVALGLARRRLALDARGLGVGLPQRLLGLGTVLDGAGWIAVAELAAVCGQRGGEQDGGDERLHA